MQRMDMLYHVSNIKKISQKLKNLFIINDILTSKDILKYVIAFFISRAVILTGLSPFGFAFFVSSFNADIKSVIIFICVILGYVSTGLELSLMKYLFAMVIFTTMYFVNKKSILNNRVFVGLIALGSILVSGYIKVVIDGMLLYDTLMLVFEALLAFILIYIMKNGFEFLSSNPRERNILSNEEVISIAIMFSLVLVGFGEIEILGTISLVNVLSILILLVLALETGSSGAAAAGVAIGLISSLSGNQMPILIGCYAFCSLVAGVFKYLGKVGVSIGFILANAIFVVYINGSTEVLISIYDILTAVILFAVIPSKSTKIIGRLLNNYDSNYKSGRTYYKKIREMLENRIIDITESLKGLGNVFSDVKDGKGKYAPYDIASVFDSTAEKVCKNCSLCMKCWGRDFNTTYQMMYGLKEKLKKKGNIDRTDFPAYFSRRCIKLNDFLITLNNLYELYRMNYIWYKKVEESRELLSEQFYSVANIMDRLKKEITSELKFDENLERDIILKLDKAGFEVRNVSVLQNIYGKYEVCIKMKACNKLIKCDENISKEVSDLIGRRMVKENKNCVLSDDLDECFVKLTEKEIYRMQVGVSQKKKKGESKCGDSYSYMHLPDGKYVLVISDGMGSGIKANKESSSAVSLIKHFLSSGFDKGTAVKLINSALVLKSPEELFTTIDLAIVDLHNGNVEFSKIGAATTFIKRKDKIEKIKSGSLPAGILKKIDVENNKNKLNDGDYIIMLSDGVMESNKDNVNIEGWLEDLLNERNETNPQVYADIILDAADKNYNYNSEDDMTVLVAKMWKKVG